jgi:hypothetical protein
LVLAITAGGSLASAQQNGAAPPPSAAPATGAAATPEKNIDETVRDFQKLTGLFTIYRQRKGGSETLYLELPESALGKLMMLQVTASTGTGGTPANVFHGAPLRDLLFRPERVGENKIALISPNINFRSPNDEPSRRALERTYPGTMLQSFDIKARQPERKSVLLDIGDFLRSDIAEAAGRFDRAGYTLDRAGSYVQQLKVLPQNIFVRTVYAANRKAPVGPGPRGFPFAVGLDLSFLPQTSYRPRVGDTRVGYFTTDFEDASDASRRDRTVNYILRWNLEKADPAAPISAPKKPIVFWMDNAIPEKYRAAVREGLLMWNPAFEAIGIKDAIEVKQMPTEADWDIADIRYNVVRWTTGNPFAIALFRANPLTGEILNAAINFDAGFASGGAASFDTIVDPTQAKPAPQSGETRHDPRQCSYAAESARENYFAELALEALQAPGAAFDREAFIHAYIREVVAHELGHDLGLRHNFIASAESSFDELKDAGLVQRKGVTASVMDYTPPNLAAVKQRGVEYYSSVVGTYDRWAIQYGYKPLEGLSREDETLALARIASRCNEPGHAFQTDELGDSYDPLVARFDLGRNPLDWNERSFELSRELLASLASRSPRLGHSYYDFTRDFNALVSRQFSAASYTARFIGGLRLNSNFRGDPGERALLAPVDGRQQRRALELLKRHVLGEGAFDFPKSYYAMLTGNPNLPGNQASDTQREFPIFNTLSNFQRGTLRSLFEPARLNRMVNNEFRATRPGQTLAMASLFREVGDRVWSEVPAGREISALRRSLQVDHLNLMVEIAGSRDPALPADAVTLANEQLRALRGWITAGQPKAKGAYGAAHLREAGIRVQKALEARPVARP